jgi:hypothetical protein
MTRKEATAIIYDIVNSGILDEGLEEGLTEICEHICTDDFELCATSDDYPNYCEGCEFECPNQRN